MTSGVERKLTTILAADAAGYSRAMGADEEGALVTLRAARDVFAKFIERHRGRIVNTAGDAIIAEFPSVVEAVQCAIEVQRELNGSRHAPGRDLRFRIGVHLGDVMVDGEDLLGEGVNLAARLQTMAEPGGVLISQQVYDQVHAKLSVGFEYLGEKRPKNFTEDVPVYRVELDGRRRGRFSFARMRHRARGHKRRARHEEERETAPPPPDLRARVIRHAKIFGAACAALFVMDLATGAGLWSFWPGLALATVVSLEAAPLFVQGLFKVQYVRIAVIVAALALINITTWSGYPWALWPASALVIAEVIRRARAG